MLDSFANFLIVAFPMFLFGYPFIMSWYWMGPRCSFLFHTGDARRRPGWSSAGRGVAVHQYPCDLLFGRQLRLRCPLRLANINASATIA
jgi:hypothetical protein